MLRSTLNPGHPPQDVMHSTISPGHPTQDVLSSTLSPGTPPQVVLPTTLTIRNPPEDVPPLDPNYEEPHKKQVPETSCHDLKDIYTMDVRGSKFAAEKTWNVESSETKGLQMI
ncbi:hypothetical protein STEG23_023575 [Scotinomys teguina]